MTVREIMTENPRFATPDVALPEVARMMVECDCGEIPVVEDRGSRQPVGVVTDRDIVVRALAKGRNPLEMTAREVMSTPAVTVTPETDVEECLRVLEQKQIRRVPVVDDSGCLCGIVSQADVARNVSARTTGEVVRTVSQPVGS